MELKKRILKKVSGIENEEILFLLEDWLEEISETEGKFSKEEISSVAEGYVQYQKGEVVDEVEANRIFAEWLKEE